MYDPVREEVYQTLGLTTVCPTTIGAERIKEMLDARWAPARWSSAVYVIVAGGGKVGYFLARALLNEGHEVLIVERDKRRADSIAEDLGSVVLRGDACEASTQADAGASRADVVVAYRRRRGQPRHLPAREAEVQRRTHGREDQQPEEPSHLHPARGRRGGELDRADPDPDTAGAAQPRARAPDQAARARSRADRGHAEHRLAAGRPYRRAGGTARERVDPADSARQQPGRPDTADDPAGRRRGHHAGRTRPRARSGRSWPARRPGRRRPRSRRGRAPTRV